MGVLLFVAGQVALYALVWWVFRTQLRVADDRSYLIGAIHFITIFAIAFTMPRIYFFFRRHGWTTDLGELRKRFRVQFAHDWHRLPIGWDIDMGRLQVIRRHDAGWLCICAALFGVHLHIEVLVDVREAAIWKNAQREAREAHLAQFPPEVRDAMRDLLRQVPEGMEVTNMGAVPVRVERPPHADEGDDDDDDDDTGGGGTKGVH